ncbi:putative dimethylaniline monooxygenase [Aspergillus uvarum CBS 121591]|uniref:Putative dimethylaniline monooxygenase n=1 Tax=Aspergillus uvarum CBS 121591 TaxID=1448315 RepID=A0A319C764_9EURO|nr:putative dimethylaniline monooxygenase [Aspergillus uvarum CBS 121591]PYH81195.1 putative dimethylaniline monooxygenase [Aspergillus uvarum CBS 121591]
MSFSGKYDIVIIGAGVAGINSAYRIQTQLPDHKYVILEARDAAGGTWDLMRYPGARLDSDIYTFGFTWHPYHGEKIMLDGESFLKYINDAATKHGIEDHILFSHRVTTAAWSSQDYAWNLTATVDDEKHYFGARYLIFATGYFDHDEALPTQIPRLDHFLETVIHPQFWPKDLDCSGKRIAVIGSGATAISLVPKLAETASAVTVIQRSPNYITPVELAEAESWLTKLLPAPVAYKLRRLRWLLITLIGYYASRRWPQHARNYLLKQVEKELPAHVPLEPHFNPTYKVWDQRLLACPNGDYFRSVRSGKVGIETANIQHCTADGLILDNGKAVDADIIVTATGLKLRIGGGIQVDLDGQICDLSDKFMWHGIMLDGVPNAFFALGYLTSASWTMGSDVTAVLACRMIRHMKRTNSVAVTPRLHESSDLSVRPLWDLNSTYIVAGKRSIPKAGSAGPWRPRSNYLRDYFHAKYGSFTEGLEYMDAD